MYTSCMEKTNEPKKKKQFTLDAQKVWSVVAAAPIAVGAAVGVVGMDAGVKYFKSTYDARLQSAYEQRIDEASKEFRYYASMAEALGISIPEENYEQAEKQFIEKITLIKMEEAEAATGPRPEKGYRVFMDIMCGILGAAIGTLVTLTKGNDIRGLTETGVEKLNAFMARRRRKEEENLLTE